MSITRADEIKPYYINMTSNKEMISNYKLYYDESLIYDIFAVFCSL